MLNMNAVNQVASGEVLYQENEPLTSISLILKGRVIATNEGEKITLGAGTFVGLSGIYLQRYFSTYQADGDVMLYAFAVSGAESLSKIRKGNKDYSGLMVITLARRVINLYNTYSELKEKGQKLFTFIKETYDRYYEVGRQSRYQPISIRVIQNAESFQDEFQVDKQQIQYASELCKMQMDIIKPFFAAGEALTLENIKRLSGVVSELTLECAERADYIQNLYTGLISDDETCLYKCVAKLAYSFQSSGDSSTELIKLLDSIIDQINDIESLLNEKCGKNIISDRDIMEQLYFSLLSGTKDIALDSDSVDAEEALSQMQASMPMLLEYSEMDAEKADSLTHHVNSYYELSNRQSTEDKVRLLRKMISEEFYQLYELVFFKVLRGGGSNRVITLFLNYGFLDERFFTKEQLLDLFYLADEDNGKGNCNIYNMKEWLMAIHSGDKMPSKSEFDLDYVETLRNSRKERKITEQEERQALEDADKKVEYEIRNMFRYNNRVVNGKISTFIPFLTGEAFNGSLKNSLISTDRMNQAIDQIRFIDYSLFYRDVLYVNEEIGIKKEEIMKEVFPDIILFPVIGENAAMWQEIDGKKRSTPGRFLFPVFVSCNLDDLVTMVLARYRWELCRTIQGSAWNNIKYKSLTSEYSDYVQFYRKNRILSEDRKEKLKMQILRAKGNMREVFVQDYKVWVTNEVEGGVRLNKVSREILAMYCPFIKKIRERLEKQPMFLESMARFERERLKKVKELDLRYRELQKDGVELPAELIQNQVYYSEW